MTRAIAIVPARNEAGRIAATVTTLRSITRLAGVIVVDDGSTDGTAERADEAGGRVIRLPRNRGKGAALRAGIAAAPEADVYCFIDGDLGASARATEVLLGPILSGDADMTIAAPPASGPSGFGLVERFARWGIRRATGVTTARPLSGQRALGRAVVDRCPIADRFAVETALTIDAIRAGFRVLEIPLPIEHARTGRDLAGFAHRARQGADVLRALAPRVFHRSRSRA